MRKENAKDKEPTLKAISYEELYYAVKAFYPDLLKTLEATTPEKFAEKMRSYDSDGKELGYTDQEIVKDKPLVFTASHLVYPVIEDNFLYLHSGLPYTCVKLLSSADNVRVIFKCTA